MRPVSSRAPSAATPGLPETGLVSVHTVAYDVCMTVSPSSVRFDPEVLRRLNAYVAAHPGTSVSAASNRLVDEALRSQEHPLIVFRDGPAGRRARLVGGPDVWEVIRATRSTRTAEPQASAEEVVAMVTDSTGVSTRLIQAAIAYWAAFPTEIDALIARAGEEEARARTHWEREHGLLAR